MEDKEIKFNVFTEEQYDKMFVNLWKIPKSWSPKRIVEKVQNAITLLLIPGMQITEEICDSIVFYRIRVFNEGDCSIDEKKALSFSYPPKKYCKLGRANRKGKQVLYTSTDEHTPFHEMASQIKIGTSIVYLSKWRIRKSALNSIYRNIFLGMPDNGEDDYASIMVRSIKEGVNNQLKEMPENIRNSFLYGQKKYTELYTSKGNELYHITSSMTHDTFEYAKKQNVDIPMIAYPSVAKDNSAINFVFRKDFVDKHMEIEEVYKVIVTELSDEVVKTSIIQKAINYNGKLKWLSPKAQNFNVGFTEASVTTRNNPNKLRKLGSKEALTVCCEKHKITVREFFERNNISEDLIIRETVQFPLNCGINEMPEQVERAFIAVANGKLYIDNNLSDDGLINTIVVPITYSVKYI